MSIAARHVVLFRACVVLYAGGVLVMGLIPIGPLPLPRTFVPQDKLMHAVVFGGLAILLFVAFRGRSLRAIGAALVATVFGGLLELLQALVPYRSADWYDLLADGVGAVGGAFLAVAALHLRNPTSDPRNPGDR